jgi:hypothetical protein
VIDEMAEIISLLESLFAAAVPIEYIVYMIDPKNPKTKNAKTQGIFYINTLFNIIFVVVYFRAVLRYLKSYKQKIHLLAGFHLY